MLGDLQTKDGWRMGLGIFETASWKPTLGGGICQGSTTLYRAALEAGMPLLEHKATASSCTIMSSTASDRM